MGRDKMNRDKSNEKQEQTEMSRKEKTVNHQHEMNEAKADQTKQQHCNCSRICFALVFRGYYFEI
jgi:uncharacterized membrane protein